MQLSRRTVLTSMVAVATAPKWSFAAEGRRILVVYYSYMGHTKSVAEKTRALVGGDLFEIEMTTPYPLDLQRMAAQSKYELETGELPPLLKDLPNVADYDLVLVGGPVWWNTVAPPVMSFLEQTDFRGRKVGLFATYALAPARYERSFAAVPVGTMVAHRPPARSVRAALPHTAPIGCFDGDPRIWMRM